MNHGKKNNVEISECQLLFLNKREMFYEAELVIGMS